jgi:ubiquitin-protein ligase
MISFSCPACGRKFSVPDSYAGRQARCACKQVMIVPGVAEASMVSTASAHVPKPAAMPGLRSRRLLADEADMRQAFSAGTLGRIVSTTGSPPEVYVIDLHVTSLVSGDANSATRGQTHRLEVQLTSDYPRVGPRCRMLTPTFHPNIDASSICIGDHWAAGEKLSDLIVRVAEMLAFQAYNIRSPLNAVAAMWTDLHANELPTDKRDLRAALKE